MLVFWFILERLLISQKLHQYFEDCANNNKVIDIEKLIDIKQKEEPGIGWRVLCISSQLRHSNISIHKIF